MTQFASSESVQANFHGVVLTNEGVRFTLSQTNDEFWARMERLEDHAGTGPPGAFDVRLGLVTGSHHMQVFWVPSGQGNAQVGFPFTWLIPEQRWVPRNSTFVRPPEAPHRAEIWNLVCCRCHTTGIEPQIDSSAHTAATRAGELGIACEACHGPGRRHMEARRAQPDQTNVDPKILASEVVHPKKLTPERASQVCGFCHSMKWFDQSENWRAHGFRYRPGDDLEQTTPIIRPSRADDIPGLADYLRHNPGLLKDFFWPDGMIRVSGRDYSGLIESPCYKGGEFSCLSCHSLHKGEPDRLVARNRDGNAACTQCHPKFTAEPVLIAHTHHRVDSSGSQCYNCHMPHTTYGVLKAIRSHQISSPKVADQLATGRPNACNLCHLDKTLGWTAARLSEWYGQTVPGLTTNQTSVAESVRLALTGDAGQRVLLAWHFGWEPARRASGENWIAPILAQLLDDDYAAVRCVAQRSLQNANDMLPAAYDFVKPPWERPPMREAAIAAWRSTLNAVEQFPRETQITLDDLPTMLRRLDLLARQRDQRPIRLRE
jgi:predicted CXXCH cytochrome family protein